MRVTYALATGALWAALSAAGDAQAHGHGGHFLRPHGLPPVSGTIHLTRNTFGTGHFSHAGTTGQANRTHGHRPAFFVARHSYGPALGYQGHAYRQLAAATRAPRFGDGYGYGVRVAPARPWWQGDGSGLVGLFGNEGDAYDGVGTGWGTADSATTGDAYPQRRRPQIERSNRPHVEAPLEIAYGEPALWSPAENGSRIPPTGGLGSYGSGSPGRVASYSSGSSAGPYGSPGGLAVYSSGAYGPGAKIIHVSRHRASQIGAGQGCFCGPRVLHVGSGEARRW